MFNLFDNLIMMRPGSIVYQGVASKAIDYFEACVYPCPVHENIADHFMDVLNIDSMKESSYLPKVCLPVDLDFGTEKR